MKVIVAMGSYANKAPEVLSDELCTTQAVGIAKGTEYLHQNGFDKLIYSIVIPYRKHLRNGSLVSVLDVSVGDSFVARVRDFSVTGSADDDGRVTLESSMTLERRV